MRRFRFSWRGSAVVTLITFLSAATVAGLFGSPPTSPSLKDWTDWAVPSLVVFASINAVAFGIAHVIQTRMITPLDRTVLAINQFCTEGAMPISLRGEIGATRLDSAFQQMSQRVVDRITALQRFGATLDQKKQQLGIILEAMVEGVIAIDDQEMILLANTAAIRLLDLKSSDLTGRPLWESVRLPKVQDLVRRTLSEVGELPRIEIEVPRTRSVLAVVVSRLPGDPSTGAVIVLHDVTNLRRLENMRSEFVSNVSHELKTPLAAITAYAEILLDGALEDPECNRRFIGRIEEQADRLHVLISELLELARMESEEHSLELVPIDVGAVLTASVHAHQDVAKSRQLKLSIAASTDVSWGLADLDGLRTIANNLLANAINYTPAGGQIDVRWYRDGGWIAFEVEDNGIGIAKENQARVFERFFREDKTRSREVGGTGLGLSIVKHLCQVFGGQVKLLSQLGKGSTFSIRLRAAESMHAPEFPSITPPH